MALEGPFPLTSASSAHGSEREEHLAELEEFVVSTLYVQRPNVEWDDVIGLQEAKSEISMAVGVPLDYPGTPQGVKAPKGILLFGPGGVGKTHIVRAVAHSFENYTFLNVDASAVISSWQGESEKVFKIIFQHAKDVSPSIIFIDEVDAFCMQREGHDNDTMRRVKSTLLSCMDGFEKDSRIVIVIGCTNRPMDLDSNFLRRFPKRIYTPLPNETDRVLLIKHFLKDFEHNLTNENIAKLAKITDRFSGSDLFSLISTASMVQLQTFYPRNSKSGPLPTLRQITTEDINTALKTASPTTGVVIVDALEKWDKEHGSGKDHKIIQYHESQDQGKQPVLSRFFRGIIDFIVNIMN